MSYNLYLLPARVVGLDADMALAYLAGENARFSQIPEARDSNCERSKRELANLLLQLKPAFREFKPDFNTIAEWEKISVEEAQRKYRHIEINGPPGSREAQFVFYEHHLVVHWYSGTSQEDMEAILYSLAFQGDFVLFDPQQNKVFDLREEANFGSDDNC